MFDVACLQEPCIAPASSRLEPIAAQVAKMRASVTVLGVPPTGHCETEMALLSDEERNTARGFHFAADRDAYVAAHALLRRKLADEIGCTPRSLRFATEANGKPRLEPDSQALQFNLTHTREMVAIVHAMGTAVGVDVEAVQRGADNAASIASDLFSADEIQLIVKADPADQGSTFIKLWTRKEAVAKAAGKGLSLGFSSFSVLPLVPGISVISIDGECSYALESRRIGHFEIAVAMRIDGAIVPQFDWQICETGDL